MKIVALISVIFAEIWLIVSIVSVNIACANGITNKTAYEPNGLRFQRILRRKKRFLLFPPGSALVVSFFAFEN